MERHWCLASYDGLAGGCFASGPAVAPGLAVGLAATVEAPASRVQATTAAWSGLCADTTGQAYCSAYSYCLHCLKLGLQQVLAPPMFPPHTQGTPPCTFGAAE